MLRLYNELGRRQKKDQIEEFGSKLAEIESLSRDLLDEWPKQNFQKRQEKLKEWNDAVKKIRGRMHVRKHRTAVAEKEGRKNELNDMLKPLEESLMEQVIQPLRGVYLAVEKAVKKGSD